jgi:phospholipase C
MWQWAKNFVLYDNFHQTVVGPSTPNAIALISGQVGQTQLGLHSNEHATVSYSNPSFPSVLGASYGSNALPSDSNAYVPLTGDAGYFPGSNLDTAAVKPPYNFDESPATPALNLTYASLPLSFMGHNLPAITAADQHPTTDLADVSHDVVTIAANNPAVNWGWYQQGYDGADAADPYEGSGGLYSGYVLHHNGPLFFGYLGDNTQVLANNMHGVADFFQAVNGRTLPAGGGVFYIRGGYNNNDGLVPVDPTPAVQHAFLGNDDHASYSDHQITEALSAEVINAVANSPYWSQSAIIITYDESDGFYDHVSPQHTSVFADGSPMTGGPRIPTLVISPYASSGIISHTYGEHGSVIKFINELYGLVPLASLPDEVHGAQLAALAGLANYSPSDNPSNNLGDLTDAFDYDRLSGLQAPIPASAATFTAAQIATLPHLATASFSPNGYTNGACKAIGVLPTDFSSWTAYENGTPSDPYPEDVNPRPTASAGTPTSASWTP